MRIRSGKRGWMHLLRPLQPAGMRGSWKRRFFGRLKQRRAVRIRRPGWMNVWPVRIWRRQTICLPRRLCSSCWRRPLLKRRADGSVRKRILIWRLGRTGLPRICLRRRQTTPCSTHWSGRSVHFVPVRLRIQTRSCPGRAASFEMSGLTEEVMIKIGQDLWIYQARRMLRTLLILQILQIKRQSVTAAENC